MCVYSLKTGCTPFLFPITLPAAEIASNRQTQSLDTDKKMSVQLLGYLTVNLPNMLTAVAYAYHSRSS